jgi:predicted nuclease with TOPRIM domain
MNQRRTMSKISIFNETKAMFQEETNEFNETIHQCEKVIERLTHIVGEIDEVHIDYYFWMLSEAQSHFVDATSKLNNEIKLFTQRLLFKHVLDTKNLPQGEQK